MSEQALLPEIRIATCNVKGAFSNVARGRAVLDWLQAADPTVVFFGEA